MRSGPLSFIYPSHTGGRMIRFRRATPEPVSIP
jgi:hypothetical protein